MQITVVVSTQTITVVMQNDLFTRVSEANQPLDQVCVVSLTTCSFSTIFILFSTLCLCAKRETTSFLVTKTDSEEQFHKLRGYSGCRNNCIISTF